MAIQTVHNYFYPRSPCGERHCFRIPDWFKVAISIHALLAESDFKILVESRRYNDFYPRSPCGERRLSIAFKSIICSFLSTLSLRRATSVLLNTQQRHIQFLSTLSLRRATDLKYKRDQTILFLSTLSLRRATLTKYHFTGIFMISIHALLAESDLLQDS